MSEMYSGGRIDIYSNTRWHTAIHGRGLVGQCYQSIIGSRELSHVSFVLVNSKNPSISGKDSQLPITRVWYCHERNALE